MFTALHHSPQQLKQSATIKHKMAPNRSSDVIRVSRRHYLHPQHTVELVAVTLSAHITG